MKVAVGTDHNGVEQKKEIIKFLSNKNIEIVDLEDTHDQFDDYPDFAIKLGETIEQKEADLGILMCGTGIGMSIAANKVKGVRCAHTSNVSEATLAKEHNNANVIAISSKNSIEENLDMVNAFINTEFKNEERHVRRIEKISKYEAGEYNV